VCEYLKKRAVPHLDECQGSALGRSSNLVNAEAALAFVYPEADHDATLWTVRQLSVEALQNRRPDHIDPDVYASAFRLKT
jgi:hypothetical protein